MSSIDLIKEKAQELDKLIDQYLEEDLSPEVENNHGSQLGEVFRDLQWLDVPFGSGE